MRSRATLGILSLLVAIAGCGTAPAQPSKPDVRFSGQRGVNAANWFTWTRLASPTTYVQPVFRNMPGELTEGDVRKIRAAGFDFIRLTVDPGVFMTLGGPSATDALDKLTAAIDRLRRSDLSVIVDMHAVSAFEPDPSSGLGGTPALERGANDPVAKRFEAAAARLAGVLDKRYGPSHAVAFELLNEPELPCGSPSWRGQQASLHRAVRTAAPQLTIVLTGACWGNIDGMTALNPADYADRNVLYSFHFYDDHSFTHQGFGAETLAATSGLPYPWNARARSAVDADVDTRLALLPNGQALRPSVQNIVNRYLSARWDRGQIDRRMSQVAAWAVRNNIANNQIVMGEFGANARRGPAMGARAEDRLRWLTDVRQAAEANGFRWAFWVYRGDGSGSDFGLTIEDGRTMDPSTLKALGLRER